LLKAMEWTGTQMGAAFNDESRLILRDWLVRFQ
jgi:hypothetical protein